MNETHDGPGATNTGADGKSSWAAGQEQRTTHDPARADTRPTVPSWHQPIDPSVSWTDDELRAYLTALRWIARAAGVDARWALPDEVREELAA